MPVIYNTDQVDKYMSIKSALIVKEDEESADLTKAELEKDDPQPEKANAILSGQNKNQPEK